MPIVLAPPDPVSPGISTGYGSAEAYSRFLPSLVQMQGQTLGEYDRGAQLSMQAGLANQQGQRQAMALAQQRTLAGQHEEAQAAQQRTALQAQAAQQQQRLQQQVQMQQTEMTFAEQQRLSRYNQAMSVIDQELSKNTITPEMAAELKNNVNGLRGPLQMKAAQASMQHQEQQTELLKQQAQQHAIAMKTFQDFAGKPQAMPIHDVDGNEIGQVVSMVGPDGKTHLVKVGEGAGGTKAGAGHVDYSKILESGLEKTSTKDPISGEVTLHPEKAKEWAKAHQKGVMELQQEEKDSKLPGYGMDGPEGKALFEGSKAIQDEPNPDKKRAATQVSKEIERLLKIPKERRTNADAARLMQLYPLVAQYMPPEPPKVYETGGSGLHPPSKYPGVPFQAPRPAMPAAPSRDEGGNLGQALGSAPT